MLKNIIYAVLLGVSMAACLSQQDKEPATSSAPAEETSLDTPAAPAAPATFVIARGHVGSVRLGTPVEQLREHPAAGLTLTDTTLMQEGMQSTAYVLRPEGEPKGLLVEQRCDTACHVWRIRVLGSDFKTAKGIGVGSKFSELQQAYNIRSVTFEEGNLVALAPETGMSFVLDKSQLPSGKLPDFTAATLPANTVVKEILVY
ncbi:hypothetical protein [Pontibacter actiniarum]|uniref:Mechanosensitive ion channel protein MscS n=1 Tax=Pontibacter actiniarum TaxID=323450 RepID=A0A1X9YTD4_9BACT|nr:hypothetical protein [Pontibacter actiniarum]ARS36127.1 hypothetical protein CA264_12190 [Pontibacter actiniarum]